MRKNRRLLILFFFSGACGLVYELLWLRLLSLTFGSTTQAVSAVLSAFMLGLAVGSWAGDRWLAGSDLPLGRAYAVLEAGIGVLGLLSAFAFRLVEAAYVAAARGGAVSEGGLTALRFALSLAAMLVPTGLMGATVPVVTRFVRAPGEELSGALGRLYAANTSGAALGTLAVGFALLPALGVERSIALAATGNLLIAALAWRLPAAPRARANEAARAPSPGASRTAPVFALAAAFLCGFTALGFEVLWTRLLSLTFGSSIYAFTLILAVFLGGIALGGFVYQRRLAARAAPLALLGALLVGLGASALAVGRLLEYLPLAYTALFGLNRSFAAFQAAQLALAGALLLVPAALFGAALPLSCRLLADRPGSLGRLYAWNTCGAILGSALTGFVLIGGLGLQASGVLLALLDGAAGLAALWVGLPRRARARGLIPAAAVLALLLAAQSRWNEQAMAGAFIYAGSFDPSRPLFAQWRDWLRRLRPVAFYEENSYGTVIVRGDPSRRDLTLVVNGKPDASSSLDDMTTQILLAHIPALLHPSPKTGLVIGLGSGVTAGSLARYPLERIDVAEIDPGVVAASALFDDLNGRPLQDPRVRLIRNDGRHHLLVCDARYDVIISEPSNPWISGVSNLFTREFYELVRARLAPGGIFCQWIHFYGLSPEQYRTVLRTYQSVFPHATLWQSYLWAGDTLLVAGDRPLSIDYARLRAALAQTGVRADLARVGLGAPADVAAKFLLGERRLAAFSGPGPLNTDDRPLIELGAPRALHDPDAARRNGMSLLSAREAVEPSLVGFDDGPALKSAYLRAHLTAPAPPLLR